MSCCDANARGAHCDCASCGRCDNPQPLRGATDHEAMLEALEKSRAAPATAYDRAQAELNQHLGSLAQMVTSLTLRFERALSRIDELELEVAKLKGPRTVVIDNAVPFDCREPMILRESPATAYPPLSDEGT